jgi:ubiquinone/menaquinone biosynthesis C-methylase UbiE
MESSLERNLINMLTSKFHSSSFDELLHIRMTYAPTSGDLLGHEIAYINVQEERGRRMIDMFHQRLEDIDWQADPYGLALDLGCGTGGSMITLSDKFEHVLGLDPSLPSLIIAKKALEDHDIENVQLIQAYGQSLPIQDSSLNFIFALNILEHVHEFDAVFGECHRVLHTGGAFCGDSRNRYDLFSPEPHVKLMWVGYLPRAWAKRYVRFRRDVSYDSTYLLSYNDILISLRKHGFKKFKITFPLIGAYQKPSWIDTLLSKIERVPGVSRMVLQVFPSHLVLALR